MTNKYNIYDDLAWNIVNKASECDLKTIYAGTTSSADEDELFEYVRNIIQIAHNNGYSMSKFNNNK